MALSHWCRLGLVSVTFRQLTPAKIVALAQRAGLEGIEWGGDIHVPHGDLARARQVRRLSESSGLEVPAYGSYYRVGHSEQEGLTFASTLDTAVELGAPLVRAWAGNRDFRQADDAYWKHIVADARRVAAMAATAGVVVAFEFHSGSLTATPDAAHRLLRQAAHPNLRTLWQPAVSGEENEIGTGDDLVAANVKGLKYLLDFVENIHVYHWVKTPEGVQRRALNEGETAWRKYLNCLTASGRAHWLLLEFVRDGSPDALIEDAATLRQWLQSEG